METKLSYQTHELFLLTFLFFYFFILLTKCSGLIESEFFVDENSQLKAIDFGLSDFVKPGDFLLSWVLTILFTEVKLGVFLTSILSDTMQIKGLMTSLEVHTMLHLKFYIDLTIQRLMCGVLV